MSKITRRSARQLENHRIDLSLRCLLGVIPEAALAACALYAIVTRHAIIYGRGGRLHLYGAEAISLGAALLAAAAFAHFHFFWEDPPRLSAYAEAGKFASLIGIASGIVFSVIKVLVRN